MTRVLIIAEHDGLRLAQSTARALSCALQIAPGGADVAVLAVDGASVAAEAAALPGVQQVLQLDDPAHAGLLAANLAPRIVALAADYGCLLAPSSTFGKDLLPRVAALLGTAQISDIMAVTGPRCFKRPIYAGNAIETVEVPEGQPIVATVRSASFKPVASGGGSASVQRRTVSAPAARHTRYVEARTGNTDRPDLQTSRIVISGGRGVGSAENFALLYRLAGRLNAAVGASRAAVDAGYVPNEMQVGQTGKIIAPDLYLAFGISGAIQHLTGIKDAGTIVAVNKDPDAPIFEIADIGLVGDLFAVIPELEKQLG